MNYSLTENYSKTGMLKSIGSIEIFFRHYARSECKAIVLIVHGFGEHSGRYSHVVDSLLASNFEVYCIDFRNHGRSEGKKGDIEKFEYFEEDIDTALNYIKTNNTKKQKIFILAHSMGALVSLRLAARKRLDVSGMVLSSPLFALNLPMPRWKLCAALSMAKILPQIKLASTIKGKHLSHDINFAKAYDHDPMVLKKITLRAFSQILEGVKNVDTLSPPDNIPIYMQVAGRDPVVKAEASQAWYARVQRPDIKFQLYPQFLHEIYNERDRKIAIDDAIKWLDQILDSQ